MLSIASELVALFNNSSQEATVKTIIFAPALFLLCAGCSSQQPSQLTQDQKDQITGEIKTICDSIVAGWNRLDMDASLAYYSDSPESIHFRGDEVALDFPAMKKNWIDGVPTLTSYTWTTTNQYYPIVSNDVVVCCWQGHSQVVMKSGDIINFKGAYTSVFRKTAGQWKVVVGHESGTAVTKKAGRN
jgi:ketosteroid isomerase-like protein